MKTAETPATSRPAPGHPPEAPLRHAALVVGRGHSKILARHCAKLAVVSVRPRARMPYTTMPLPWAGLRSVC
jgi:hypothetical protein